MYYQELMTSSGYTDIVNIYIYIYIYNIYIYIYIYISAVLCATALVGAIRK